jgi:hypothetical protein
MCSMLQVIIYGVRFHRKREDLIEGKSIILN